MPLSYKQRLIRAIQALRGRETGGAESRPVPAITPEEAAEARIFFPMPKFFIYGHARSGTTMLVRTVRIHPQVHCDYQAHFFSRQPLLESLVASPQAGEWLARPSNRWNRGRDLSPVVLRAAADFIMEREARRLGKTIVGDKSPNSLMDGQAVHLLYKTYPDASLVYIVRDGRDAALSHRFQTFIEFPDRLGPAELEIRSAFSSDPAPFLEGKRSIFTAHSLQRAAEGWVRNVTETIAVGKELYGERFFSLRYEDLLATPWEELVRLWRFLGAVEPGPEVQQALQAEMSRNPDADWQREKASQIGGALQKGQRGSWRQMFTENDKAVFERIAGETLRAWGYPE